ncbi:hypothetical protein [Candidatus Enterococcus mansonii]|uniref:Lipoprotein n=1 Tax=Candidatus Enterococcus mansonii TaxID=1834181 RepID=A0A242CK10_9ENTE|nr:hypothetical protein [Enterococcus sp. 4G2_DIV0659]OTO10250.1 hypothetical protein A5880_000934 [Enterococcus sp. 4G2_DIV0659]
MKELKTILVALLLVVVLVGCGSKKEAEPDYTEAQAEKALNAGDDLEGKTVKIKVLEYVPNGPLGYTIQAGEHLNFISSDNPKVKKGDELVVKIKKVESALGSFIISYDKA